MENTLKDYTKNEETDSFEERIDTELGNRFLGLQSSPQDAQLTADIVKFIAEKNVTVNRAISALKDAEIVIPRIATFRVP